MATGQEQEKEEEKEIKIIIIIIRTQQQDKRLSMGSSPWERSHRVREIQNPVPSGRRGQQVLGLV